MNANDRKIPSGYIVAPALFIIAGILQYCDEYVPLDLMKIFFFGAQIIFFALCAWWVVSLVRRVAIKGIRNGLIATVASFALMLFIKILKYSFFAGEVETRYLWYSFYIPLCFAPVFLLFSIIETEKPDGFSINRKWYLMLLAPLLLVVLVFTNDLHQLVFSFQPDFVNSNSVYERKIGYFIIMAWIVCVFTADVLLLFIKCRNSACRKKAWIPLLTFIVCFALIFAREYIPTEIYNFQETILFSVIVICESLIYIGFIPSNKDHAMLFDSANISAIITDKDKNIVLASKTAPQVTKKQLEESCNSYIYLDENTKFYGSEISGGAVYWSQDLTAINSINSKIREIGKTLSEENVLITSENEIKAKQSKIAALNKLYDEISESLRPCLDKVCSVLDGAKSGSPYEKAMKTALIYGAYIKRRSNLAIIGDKGTANAKELTYAIAESLDALSFYGASSAVKEAGGGALPYCTVAVLYDFFEDCIELALPDISACFVTLSVKDAFASLRISMENPSRTITENYGGDKLKEIGATVKVKKQDSTIFATMQIPFEEGRI